MSCRCTEELYSVIECRKFINIYFQILCLICRHFCCAFNSWNGCFITSATDLTADFNYRTSVSDLRRLEKEQPLISLEMHTFTCYSELSGTDVLSTENHMLPYLHYKYWCVPEEEDRVRWLLKSLPNDPEATWKAPEKVELWWKYTEGIPQGTLEFVIISMHQLQLIPLTPNLL